MCVVAVLMCIDLLLGEVLCECVVAVLMCIDLLLGKAMRDVPEVQAISCSLKVSQLLKHVMPVGGCPHRIG